MAEWNFAVHDWWQRLQAGRTLMPDLPLDQAEATRAVKIFNRLRLPDVPGQPFLADAAGEWQREIVAALFGSLEYRADSAGNRAPIRHVPNVFVLVPKKNSKTTGGAAIMLTALLMNQRPNARFALFGPTQEIADIAFRAIADMIGADADLQKLCHVQDHLKQITLRTMGAVLKIMTFDPSVATGGKFAGWLLDEAHLLGAKPYAERVIAQLRGARVAISESFGVIITTQSDVPPAGAFKAELDYARAVRDGRIKAATVLPILYEMPEEVQRDASQWREPALWPTVLPNLGRSVSLAVLEDEYRAARDKGPAEERLWASQHLNIQIGVGLHSDRWAGADHWEAAALPGLTLAALMERSEVCTIGIDGGGLDDLLGVTVMGRERETGTWLSVSKAIVARKALALRKDIAAALTDFERAGDLIIVDNLGEDLAHVAAIVMAVHGRGLLPEKHGIGLDMHGISALTDALVEAGVPQEMFAGIAQGFRLNGVIHGSARRLADGSFRPAAQPLMAWCVGNAKTEQRGNALLITKQVSGSAKIDPLLALFSAFELMSRHPQPAGGPSVYETRGVLTV